MSVLETFLQQIEPMDDPWRDAVNDIQEVIDIEGQDLYYIRGSDEAILYATLFPWRKV